MNAACVESTEALRSEISLMTTTLPSHQLLQSLSALVSLSGLVLVCGFDASAKFWSQIFQTPSLRPGLGFTQIVS